MKDKVKEILDKIEKDCLQLKRQKKLTKFGYGQLYLIRIIKEAEKKEG